MTAATNAPGVVLRPATTDDVDAIAGLGQAGWVDGRCGNVPAGLRMHRRPAAFRRWVHAQLDATTVATSDDKDVVGFVTVRGDEVV